MGLLQERFDTGANVVCFIAGRNENRYALSDVVRSLGGAPKFAQVIETVQRQKGRTDGTEPDQSGPQAAQHSHDLDLGLHRTRAPQLEAQGDSDSAHHDRAH